MPFLPLAVAFYATSMAQITARDTLSLYRITMRTP
jgi:hypothetical protein